MDDPKIEKKPVLIWAMNPRVKGTWYTDLNVGGNWHPMIIHRNKGGFRLDLPFFIDHQSNAQTPEEAQAEAEQYMSNVLLEAAARLRQPSSADHVE